MGGLYEVFAALSSFIFRRLQISTRRILVLMM